MNERLEKEIQEWITSHIKAPKDSTYAPAVIEWGKIVAKHFYNLALQDVREELSYRADFFHGRGMGCDNAIEEEMCNIIDFIDNLIK